MGLNYVLGSYSPHAMAKDVRVIQLQIVQQIAEEEKAWEYFVEARVSWAVVIYVGMSTKVALNWKLKFF